MGVMADRTQLERGFVRGALDFDPVGGRHGSRLHEPTSESQP